MSQYQRPLVLLPIAAAAATGVQVGAAIVATRYVLDQTSPATLAMMRYSIGVLVLLPALLLTPRTRFARGDILPIALLGIGQFGILIALLNFGLLYIPAGRAALIFATFPLLTLLFAAALGRESLTLRKTISVLLTLLGVGLALGEAALAGSGDAASWIGGSAVFASAACGAACSVLYRPYLLRYPTIPVSAFAMLASVAFLAVLAAAEGFFSGPPQISPSGWGAIVFIGVSSGIGYVLWLWALRHASPTRVTVFLALSPLTAILLGALLLGEAITSLTLLGLLCVVWGLWLVQRPQRP